MEALAEEGVAANDSAYRAIAACLDRRSRASQRFFNPNPKTIRDTPEFSGSVREISAMPRRRHFLQFRDFGFMSVQRNAFGFRD